MMILIDDILNNVRVWKMNLKIVLLYNQKQSIEQQNYIKFNQNSVLRI